MKAEGRAQAGPALRDRARIQALLAAHPLFAGVPGPDLEAVLRRADVLHLSPGEILYTAGESARGVSVVLSGAIQIEYPAVGEVRGYVAAMLEAPAFVGECQVLHERTWSGTGVALLPVVAVGLDRQTLEALIREQPRFALAAYREITERFLNAIDTWRHQVRLSPSETLARYLLSVATLRERAGVSPEALLEIRQVDLGLATGLRRETINRVLKAWERQSALEIHAKGLAKLDLGALSEALGEGRPLLFPARASP